MAKKKKRKPKHQKYPQPVQPVQAATPIPPCRGKREGNLCFEFPEGWEVEKYDAWKFVKNDINGQYLGFNGIKDRGIRSVDFCAIDTESALWLIEVKDYRKSKKEYEDDFFTTICDKFLYSMSGLFAARYGAIGNEKEFAKKSGNTNALKFVLHLELPEATDTWDAATIDVKDVQDKMNQKFSRVAPNPLLVSLKYPQNLPWSVRDVPS